MTFDMNDMLGTGVVGLVGEPFSIETTSDYEKATLTYVIDKNKLGDTEFDNLMFLWYDEKKDEFVELDTILDEENSTVSRLWMVLCFFQNPIWINRKTYLIIYLSKSRIGECFFAS